MMSHLTKQPNVYSRSSRKISLPPKPLTPAKSAEMRRDDESLYMVHVPEGMKIFPKWIDPPLLEAGKTTQWKSDMESFVRRMSPDGHMPNVMFAIQRYHKHEQQDQASTAIYDVLIFAIKNVINIHSITKKIRDDRDGSIYDGC